jgi:hypothetical protein
LREEKHLKLSTFLGDTLIVKAGKLFEVAEQNNVLFVEGVMLPTERLGEKPGYKASNRTMEELPG